MRAIKGINVMSYIRVATQFARPRAVRKLPSRMFNLSEESVYCYLFKAGFKRSIVAGPIPKRRERRNKRIHRRGPRHCGGPACKRRVGGRPPPFFLLTGGPSDAIVSKILRACLRKLTCRKRWKLRPVWLEQGEKAHQR
jgi:hypothetical protein